MTPSTRPHPFRKLQAFKEREPEQVRWRSVKGHVSDVNLLAQLEDMRTLVYQNTTPMDLNVLVPGSASELAAIKFIAEAHRRSLEATNLKQDKTQKAASSTTNCCTNCLRAP